MTKTRKKYNPHKRNEMRFMEYRERFWLAGANCLPTPIIGGTNSGQAGVEQMVDSFKNKHRWRGYAVVFQSNGSQQWVDSIFCEAMKPVYASEFRDYIDAAQDRLMDEANDKFICTPGYICTISQTADMQAMFDSYVQLMKSEGAFNAEWCVYCYYLRPS